MTRRGRTAAAIGRTKLGPRPVPPLGTAVPARWPQLRETVLDNGLRVVVIRRPSVPLVELRLRVPFASRTPAQVAAAELVAATWLLGTSRQSRADLDLSLAAVGGRLSAGVDPQRFSVSGSALSRGLPTLLEVLADGLTDPLHRAGDVTAERERLLDQLRVAASQPTTVVRELLQKKRFDGHPLSWELPEPASVGLLTRAAVQRRHRTGLVPDGAILVLVGDLAPRATLELVAQHLGSWLGERPARRVAKPPALTAGPVVGHHRGGAVQAQIRLSAPAPDRTDPQYAAAKLANLVYGGYFSSRLVENLREAKGYTYSASSGQESWPGRAGLTVGFDTRTEVAMAALWEAKAELGRLALAGPTAAEVEAARQFALGSGAINRSTQAGLAATVTSLAEAGLGLPWLRDHTAALQCVTVDEVAAAAARWLNPADFTGIVLGDLEAMGPAALRAVEVQW